MAQNLKLICFRCQQIVAEFYQRKAKQQSDKKEEKQDGKTDDKLIDA
jgi:hypothetical protein